jgi:Xaa-Pro dipeptidase
MNNPYPTNPPFSARQSRLEKLIAESELDCIALNPGSSLTYLTGLTFHLMERPVVAFFIPGAQPGIILPELELPKLQSLSYQVRPFSYSDDPAEWAGVFKQAIQSMGISQAKVGVEPLRLRFLELRFLENAAQQARFLSAERILADLRVCKDPGEIAAMRAAVDIAQRALEATLPSIKPGATERQIAAELTLQMLKAGSEPELPFAPIVSAGPNSANPHASPSDRPLQKGDLLVIDWGAYFHGYVSDLTRTFGIGEVEAEFENIAEIVIQANAAGRAAAAPGVPAGEVDRAARQVIESAGYGALFFHRTGHGIGMEGHEEPYIRAGNPLLLQPGMAFTIEPGIYLAGRGGVRFEDNVVITPDGVDCLSDLPRLLRILK